MNFQSKNKKKIKNKKKMKQLKTIDQHNQEITKDILEKGKMIGLNKEDVDVCLCNKGGGWAAATIRIEDDDFYFAQRPLCALRRWIDQYFRLFFSEPLFAMYPMAVQYLAENGIDVGNDLLYDYVEKPGQENKYACNMVLRHPLPHAEFCTFMSIDMPSKLLARVYAVSLFCTMY